MDNLKKLIKEIINELEIKLSDGILEETNFCLLKKMLNKAETQDEAIAIGTLGTTFKKTGFKFEEKIEKFTDEIKYLSKNSNISFGEGIKHKLIIGDNYDALLNLLITHRNKVNVIYIDPPYGSNDLGEFAKTNYQNKINRDNLLSMLQPRLFLSKMLLTDEGMFFCSIDDKNQAYLKGLLDDVYGEENFIACMPRVVKKGGKSPGLIAKNSDYLLIYAKDKNNIEMNRLMHEDDGFRNEDKHINERGRFKLNQCLDYNSLQYSYTMDFPIEINGETFYPGGHENLWKERQAGKHNNHDWVWRWSKPLIEFGLKNDFIVVNESKNGKRIYTKTYLNCEIQKNKNNEYEVMYKERQKDYDSLYFVNNVFSNDQGKKDLDLMEIGNTFNYPKPVSLVKECLKMASNSNVVLDFFAGSGTTGEAVLALNNEDGVNREFILCTNNEVDEKMHFNGIAKDITLERIHIAMTGKSTNGIVKQKWLKNDSHKPYGGVLEVYEIEKAKINDINIFNLIDPICYGVKKESLKEKIEWISENFKIATKELK
ncbi:site-specific DNA-methyltransferase [Williamsoniiplasma luminosum]|uniref:Site-specific DNA-methyltransferase n=1 Tax=Williamsoniiplasma luminosum TaxID=214888 RepID=A0A2S0NJ03_9MOLU|nr:site-specific DNA-methyltransferase [Williamsoniiplasma luminosum]AVP48999.1 MAG: site-specific DNA-methyltransferase [Williamsoniiplasma luminosum]